MNNARYNHRTSLLSNGKVLVTGGQYTPEIYVNTTELYDPLTGIWTLTGSMNNARIWHTESVLQNGKVLVTGGQYRHLGRNIFLKTAELYDPSTGIWTITNNMSIERTSHTESVLTNGKVLITGGFTGNSYPHTCELYDPLSETWTLTGSLYQPRDEHAASILKNGQVLVTGGFATNSSNGYINIAELYDSSTEEWTRVDDMAILRSGHTASVLTNGDVLITGGYNLPFYGYYDAELYTILKDRWIKLGSMIDQRTQHTASVLNDGKVLVIGGYNFNHRELNSVELYDPSMNMWTAVGSMIHRRRYHTATVLTNGTVLIAGGCLNNIGLDSAELY
jgi:N-acetylneuraminic acid mutarotase